MKTPEEIEKLAELYVWGGIYLTETEKQQTEIAYMSGYNQCQEDMADKKYTEKQILRAIDLATQVYEKKDGNVVYAGAMSAQNILTTLETEKYTNPEGLPYKEFPPKKQDNE